MKTILIEVTGFSRLRSELKMDYLDNRSFAFFVLYKENRFFFLQSLMSEIWNLIICFPERLENWSTSFLTSAEGVNC